MITLLILWLAASGPIGCLAGRLIGAGMVDRVGAKP